MGTKSITPRYALFIRQAVSTAEAWCYHPDMAMGWIRPAVKAALKLSGRQKPNVVWATAGPVSSFIVARRFSMQTGVPYVLDFRDAWTIIPTEFDRRRPKWARNLDQRRMFRLLNRAHGVVFRYERRRSAFGGPTRVRWNGSRIHLSPTAMKALLIILRHRGRANAKSCIRGLYPTTGMTLCFRLFA